MKSKMKFHFSEFLYAYSSKKKKLNWLKKFVDFTNQKLNMLNKISKGNSWKSKNRKCLSRYFEITRLDFFSTPGNERK